MQRIFQSRWLAGLFLLLLVFFGLSAVRLYGRIKELRGQISTADKNIQDVARRTRELEHNTEYLKSGAYLERQARLTLNVKKPGEKIVYFYANQYTTQDLAQDSSASVSRSWWQELVGSVFH
ncbi:MAG: hypothetical protein A3A33_02610 [Candidatus Yanofskybacteria bacterium RIFCSPLOWO2_01_FULL_49_25]|uniref:Septum formation initiator n=1 Tax=Candidatus Yanofskybacteria bacterium RIFCSPLOWO2_01_FULL_49_25 TaxID=1802701 RepID=A0A1F8GVV9_9BACT|nr:MAG: hypothetical protein A3A33_02610 [Candidatus Yanofskybacteria bacterium RIFCSPLOWO2_01_FULL_49_25]